MQQHIVSDMQNGDVAYFTRQIGQRRLLHDGVTPVEIHAGTHATDFYADNGLAPVQAIFTAVATDPTYRTYLKTIGDALKSVAANGGAQGPSQNWRNELH